MSGLSRPFLSRRVRSVAALAGVTVGVLPLVAAAPASAESGYSQCTGQDRVVSRSVRLTSNTFRMTHADVLDLGRGFAYHRSRTLSRVTTLSASATGTTSVTGSASWKIAKLDATVSVSLSASGTHTTTSSVTEDFDIDKSTRNRKILFYSGNQYAKGTWHQLTCSRVPGRGTAYDGTVHSFANLVRHGAIECNHRLYSAGSIRYQVSVQAGC